jgi:hypothetical protein
MKVTELNNSCICRRTCGQKHKNFTQGLRSFKIRKKASINLKVTMGVSLRRITSYIHHAIILRKLCDSSQHVWKPGDTSSF